MLSNKMINTNTTNSFICNPDMIAIKKILVENELFDEDVQYIFGIVHSILLQIL